LSNSTDTTVPNIAIGHGALELTTSGRGNIAIGEGSQRSNIIQENNISIGHTGLPNPHGGSNIAIGNQVLQGTSISNTIGIGQDAGDNYSSSNLDVFIGIQAAGFANVPSGASTRNVMAGAFSGYLNANGSDNTFIGFESGYTGLAGDRNVFIGSRSGITGPVGTTGTVCIGYQSGAYTTGNFNTFLGYQTGYTGTNYYGGTGLICIGANAYPTSTSTSNECTINVGGEGVGAPYVRYSGAGVWQFVSDMRDKTDIGVISSGIDLINQIRPSKYRWDKREWYANGVPDGSKKNEKWYGGFIAQQLDEVQTANEAEYLNLVFKSNLDKLEIAPSNLIPVIVKALQDLSSENSELKLRVAKLEEKLAFIN
jgi:hypothetical protein